MCAHKATHEFSSVFSPVFPIDPINTIRNAKEIRSGHLHAALIMPINYGRRKQDIILHISGSYQRLKISRKKKKKKKKKKTSGRGVTLKLPKNNLL